MVVISAPSGCGKTTVVQELLKKSRKCGRSVSVTTRKARPGESAGEDYFFVSKRDFLSARRRGEFLEWAKVFGQYYGTPRRYVKEQLARGRNVILAIDVDGAEQVRRKIDCVSIFLMPPSLEALEKRLRGRKSDSAADIRRRLKRARFEMKCAKDYDYLVVNRDVSRAMCEIRDIIRRRSNGKTW